MADGRGRVDSDMGIAAMFVGTVTTDEMQASRDSLRGRLVGEIASIASGTNTFSQVVLANGNFFRVVDVSATGPSGTCTCQKSVCYIQTPNHRVRQRVPLMANEQRVPVEVNFGHRPESFRGKRSLMSPGISIDRMAALMFDLLVRRD